MVTKKTLLRHPKNFKLNEKQLKSLNEIIGEFDIKDCETIFDLKLNYEERVQSLSAAFSLILETLPLKKEVDSNLMQNYLDWCNQQAVFPNEADIEIYQDILVQYIARLVDGLVNYCESISIEKAATKLINKAEQYALLKTGRADIVTVIPFKPLDEDKQTIHLIWERQLPPCAEATFEELEAIKRNRLRSTPDWFRKLPVYQQTYLHLGKHKSKTPVDIKFELNCFKWQEIKKLYASTLHSDLERIAVNNDPLPTWYNELSLTLQNNIQLLLQSGKTVKEFDANLESLHQSISYLSKQFNEQREFSTEWETIHELPYWFLRLSATEQLFLKKILDQSTDVKATFAQISSRLRTLPLLANFGTQIMLELDEYGELSTGDELNQYRLSHIVSRDLLNQPDLAKLYAKLNLDYFINNFAKNKLVFIQTLISPIWTGGLKPDYKLDQYLQETINELRKTNHSILAINHPFNYVRLVQWTDKNNPTSQTILNLAKCHLRLKELPLLQGEWNRSSIEKLVDNAFAEFKTKIKNQPITTNTNEEELTQKLIEQIGLCVKQLDKEEYWKDVFKQHLYTIDNVKEQEEYLTYKQRLDDLAFLSEEYQKLLDLDDFGSATLWDINGRELCLSSLENLQIGLMGGVCLSSCVSGKDREWVMLCHTIAMIHYKKIYKKWPSPADTGVDRANFVNIAADIYLSGHGHFHAGQNAPGANGIKTPDVYWPGDIAAEIEKRRKNSHHTDDSIASNNVVDDIPGVTAKLNSDATCYVTGALKLSVDNQELVITHLKKLLNEKNNSFWLNEVSFTASFYKSEPTGISSIRVYLEQDINNTQKLASIYQAIIERPTASPTTENSSRGKSTQKLYESIIHLYKQGDQCIEEELKKLIELQCLIEKFNDSQKKSEALQNVEKSSEETSMIGKALGYLGF